MVPLVSRLVAIADAQHARLLSVSPDISVLAAGFDWAHRDPFDRLIAATALAENIVLVSADDTFDDLVRMPGWPGRVW